MSAFGPDTFPPLRVEHGEECCELSVPPVHPTAVVWGT